jgi:hypothetical protein
MNIRDYLNRRYMPTYGALFDAEVEGSMPSGRGA